jgi:hypothetical protein
VRVLPLALLRNEVFAINGVFSSLSLALSLSLLSLLSPDVTVLPEGVIVGFRNFAWGFNSQKNKIWGENKFGGCNVMTL